MKRNDNGATVVHGIILFIILVALVMGSLWTESNRMEQCKPITPSAAC